MSKSLLLGQRVQKKIARLNSQSWPEKIELYKKQQINTKYTYVFNLTCS